ncbi:gp43, RepA like protein [Corynebacterium phage BFK20]|uniref:Gp43, RepA like protein n=1 Tax=Corynebacterium phage BFK20 TaxID=28358 RepID=Q3V5F2_9CAUD|nr:DNA polymerase/primase [Corynebacterium phage BFK20]CAJ29726.2 gp43, RepA like protein [Corynebacterium phage BFK20]
MLGSTMLTTLLGAPPQATADTATIKRYAGMLMKEAGLHLLLVQPGTKVPADMRNAKEKEADVQAGKRAGVYLATNDKRTLDKYIGRYRKAPLNRPSKVNPSGYGEDAPVSLGVHLGPSRLVVIDADTPEEVEALKTYWANAEGIDRAYIPHMTVATPGQTDAQGNKVHSEGGHWYFTLPDGYDINPMTVPSAIAVTVEGVGQFTVKTGNSYVLIPPSEREGRAYTMCAPDQPAPLWLLQLIKERENTAAADPQGARAERDRAEREYREAQARALGQSPTPAVETEHKVNPADLFQHGIGEPREEVQPKQAEQQAPEEVQQQRGAGQDTVQARQVESQPSPLFQHGIADPDELDDETETYKRWDGDTLDEQLDSWSLETSWDDILDPHGWTDSGRTDSCGCRIWTRPDNEMGPSSTYKSMTTHESGCHRERTDNAHPACHVWTEHPGYAIQALLDRVSTRTVSKFSLYTALNHANDYDEAYTELGIDKALVGGGTLLDLAMMGQAGGLDDSRPSTDAERMAQEDSVTPASAPAPEQWVEPVDVAPQTVEEDTFKLPYMGLFTDGAVVTPSGRDVFEEWGLPRPDKEHEDGTVSDEWKKQVPSFGSFQAFRDMPAVKWTLDGWLERGGLLSLIGPSGVGKSAVVLDIACSIASGLGHWQGIKCDSHPVIYVAGEGVTGAVERVTAWERANNMVGALDNKLYVVPESVSLNAPPLTWAYISHLARGVGAGLIVLDTFARMSSGLEENSSKDMTVAVNRLDKVRRTSGAGVLVVHHTTRGATHGRGSTALNGAMDSEILLTKPEQEVKDGNREDPRLTDNEGDEVRGKGVVMRLTKQKNGPDGYTREVVLTEEEDVRIDHMYAPALKTGMVVTDVNGRPASYRTDYLQGEAPRHFAPPKPEKVEVTAQRVLDFISEFRTLELTTTSIRNGVEPDVYHKDKMKMWATHLQRVLDLLVTQGKLERDGRTSFKRPDEYVTVDSERETARP